MGKLLKAAAAALAAAGAAAAALFIWIDARVAGRLKSRQTPKTSALYSDTVTISASSALPPEDLAKVMEARGFRRSPAPPEKPGEFFLSGNGIEVYTLPFRTPRAAAPAVRAVLGGAGQTIALPPIELAPLGEASMPRAQPAVLAAFPERLKQAVIAVEDERFYAHHGLDLTAIGRAAWANLKALRIKQGGSTLTQQLAKNMFFSRRRSWGRKLLEALAALSLEMRLEKREILELYLNEIYLGQEGAAAIYGFAAAADAFFRKPVTHINLAEAALLAGVVQAPTTYNPRRRPRRARERQSVVLSRMESLGLIASEERRAAELQPLHIAPPAPADRSSAWFSAAVLREAGRRINLAAAIPAGVRIYTGFLPEIQACAERAVERGLREVDRMTGPARGRRPQGALAAIDPASGLVRAWVGGRSFADAQYDRAGRSRRQIGSTIKPFLYAAAMESGGQIEPPLTAESLLPDRPISVRLPSGGVWRPENFDGRFRGPVTVRQALEQSLNLPAVHLAERIGYPAFARKLEAFGLGDHIRPLPSLTLGALDASLLSLTAAYAALAEEGLYTTPRLFIAVTDGDEDLLITGEILQRRAVDKNAAREITQILRGVIDHGTGRLARAGGFEAPAAGKTGTSDGERDAWFVGYTPGLAAGVWIGRDDNSPLGLTGGEAAAPIWGEFMRCAAPFSRSGEFALPDAGQPKSKPRRRPGGLWKMLDR